MARIKDYYAMLGCQPRSHAHLIEEKYWEQAHELHGEPTKKAAKRLTLINEAYETLASPYKREAYDRRRAEHLAADAGEPRPTFFQSFVSVLGKAFRPD